jgi:hypothetical protein
MQTERTVLPAVLDVLRQSPALSLSTGELREKVKERLKLTSHDLEPLVNRGDTRIDQIIRNLKCHRKTPGNPFFEGILESVPGGFKLK